MEHPLIRKLGKFTRLSREDRETLSRLGTQRIRKFAAREDVIREGERPEYINLIIDGWACRYKVLEDGRRQIISFFLPGDLCDLNIFVLKQMDHSIAAVTPLTLSEISQADFDELMQAHPRVTQGLWWESLVSAAIQREWTVTLGQRDAPERLAHLFCELFLRLEIAGLADGNSCDMPLTQTELGDAMGLSTVHVNRTLQELRAANLIVLRDRVLTIPSMDALRKAAMFNDNYLHLGGDGAHLDANE